MTQEKITLSITGMTCASCAMIIEQALKEKEGVVGAEVDVAKGEAVIEYDTTRIDHKGLVKVIQEAGYDVSK